MSQNEPIALPIEPSLDLHAFAPRDIPGVVNDYLEAAHDKGFTEVRLIHGRGKGVQRAVVQRVLSSHRLVVDHWDAPDSHLGATIVRFRTRGCAHAGVDSP
jgi:DNA-nicking Smr family endonuclease